MGTVKVKRIYRPVEKTDGKRILVDRLWPRGVSKEAAHLDEWMKEIAPSTGLRQWFHHDSANWDEFTARYLLELKQNPAVGHLLDIVKQNETVTLLYSAHDEQHNQALVLLDVIHKALDK